MSATATETVENPEQDAILGFMNKLPDLDKIHLPPEGTPSAAAATPPPGKAAVAPEKPAGEAENDKGAVTPTAAEKPAAEPAKAAEKAPEKDKATDAEAEKETWPRNAEDWDRFKAKRKAKEEKLQGEIQARETRLTEFTEKVKTMEAELEKLRTKATDVTVSPELQAELDRLKKENEEYSNRLAVTEVTAHPKFQTYFQNRVQEQMDLAKEIVGADKADAVVKALSLPAGEYRDLKIEEALAELSPLQQSRFGAVINELHKIDREKESEIAKARESRAKIQTEQKAKQEQAIVENKRVFQNIVKAVQDPKDGLPVYQLRQGDEKWNQGVKDRIAMTERILFGGEGVKPDDIVRHALNAAAFPVLLESYKTDLAELQTEKAKLEAQVKELSAVQPRTSTSAAAPPDDGAPKAFNPGSSPQEAMDAWFKKINGV